MIKKTFKIIILVLTILSILSIIDLTNNEYNIKYNGYKLIIPSINFNESLNNESLTRGVLMDNKSAVPGEGKIFLFGHRLSMNSNFFRLNELKVNDNVLISNGDRIVNYIVNDSYIVSPEYILPLEPQSNTCFLITCYPIGSSAKRLIVECVGV
jgi:LPXTG-site transpeptidase (sortase) family protein